MMGDGREIRGGAKDKGEQEQKQKQGEEGGGIHCGFFLGKGVGRRLRGQMAAES